MASFRSSSISPKCTSRLGIGLGAKLAGHCVGVSSGLDIVPQKRVKQRRERPLTHARTLRDKANYRAAFGSRNRPEIPPTTDSDGRGFPRYQGWPHLEQGSRTRMDHWYADQAMMTRPQWLQFPNA